MTHEGRHTDATSSPEPGGLREQDLLARLHAHLAGFPPEHRERAEEAVARGLVILSVNAIQKEFGLGPITILHILRDIVNFGEQGLRERGLMPDTRPDIQTGYL